MTVLEFKELLDDFKERFDVTAAAPVAMAAAPAGGDAAAEDEQSEFEVVLTGGGEKKIGVIKVVRELTGAGLKDAKDLVDGAPSTIRRERVEGRRREGQGCHRRSRRLRRTQVIRKDFRDQFLLIDQGFSPG